MMMEMLRDEKTGPDPRIVIEVGDMRRRLSGNLVKYSHPCADELREVLLDRTDKINLNSHVGVLFASETLQDVIWETVLEVKAGYGGKLRAGYPTEYDESDAIVQPRRYAKRNNLSNAHLPQLRDVHESEMRRSKAELVSALSSDTFGERLDQPVSHELLEQNFRTLAEAARDKIYELADAIDALLGDALGVKTQKEVGSFALRRSGDIGTAESQSEFDHEELIGKLKELTNLLGFARRGTRGFAEAVTQHHTPATREYARERSVTHYDSLATDAASRLAHDLRASYDAAVAVGPQQSKEHRPEPITQPLVVSDPALAYRESHEKTDGPRTIELGRMPAPFFPWMKKGRASGEIDLSLIRQNGDSMLVCRAFSPSMSVLSERLRAHKHKADKFSVMARRIEEVELSGNAVSHPWIKMVRDADFHDLTVRYFTSMSTVLNNGRMYYARTTIGRYDELRELATARGLNRHTPLLIMLAETDKGNQLEVYENLFGIDRATARQGRVGAI